MKTVTRRQLIELGASKYQAELVTKSLTPLRKQGSANVYNLFDVGDRCRALLENRGPKAATREAIQTLRWELLSLAEEIQDAPFGMTGLEQLEYADQLRQRADTLFAQTKARAQEIKKPSSKKAAISARGKKR